MAEREYLCGITYELLGEMHEEILQVQKRDLYNIIDVLKKIKETSSVCLMSKEKGAFQEDAMLSIQCTVVVCDKCEYVYDLQYR